MEIRISRELYTILLYARDEAMRTGCFAIAADHLLLGILRHEDNAACLLLKECGADLAQMKKFVDSCVFTDSSIPYGSSDKMGVARSAQNVINMSAYEALKAGSEEVTAIHLLLALARSARTATADYLGNNSIGVDTLTEKLYSHGWRRPSVPSASDEEDAKKSIETQMRSMVVFTYPSQDEKVLS